MIEKNHYNFARDTSVYFIYFKVARIGRYYNRIVGRGLLVMIIPTDEEMKMYVKFAPLEEWRKRAYGTELRDDAPEDMKLLALE